MFKTIKKLLVVFLSLVYLFFKFVSYLLDFQKHKKRSIEINTIYNYHRILKEFTEKTEILTLNPDQINFNGNLNLEINNYRRKDQKFAISFKVQGQKIELLYPTPQIYDFLHQEVWHFFDDCKHDINNLENLYFDFITDLKYAHCQGIISVYDLNFFLTWFQNTIKNEAKKQIKVFEKKIEEVSFIYFVISKIHSKLISFVLKILRFLA